MRKPYLPPERIAIVSVAPYPIRVEAGNEYYVSDAAPADKNNLPKGEGRYTYVRLEKAPEEKTIGARAQWIDSMVSEDIKTGLRSDWTPMTIPVESLAEDIVNKASISAFRSDFDARPGVMALPVGREKPTEDELRSLYAIQEKYARKAVLEARRLQHRGEFEKIDDEHHMWAKWLGMGDDPFMKNSMMTAPQGDSNAVLAAFMKSQEQIKDLQNQLADLVAASQTAPADPAARAKA